MASRALAPDSTHDRVMLRVLTAVKRGDFTVRMPLTSTGQAGKVAIAIKDRPIIALTAKAMKGDRERFIEAGASDYIAKPVVSSHLVAMVRSWLTQ